jgi:uncharacterized protein YlzI (FlbEa/FlbD family)
MNVFKRIPTKTGTENERIIDSHEIKQLKALPEVMIETENGHLFFVSEILDGGKSGIEIRVDRQILLDVHAANSIVVRNGY